MKSFLTAISPRSIGRAFLAVGVVFALTAVMLLIGPVLLGQGVIALLYLLPIGWCTFRWGQIAGVSAAMTAALSFDFFFIPPYGTFTIGSPEGWLLFILFVSVSVLVIGRIQTTLSDWKNRERNATFLYEMVVAIANQQTREEIAQIIANQIQQNYQAKQVNVYLNHKGEWGELVMCSPVTPDCATNGKPDRELPIAFGPSLVGEIAIWKGLLPLPNQNDPMIQSLLRQAGSAINRVQNTDDYIQPTTRLQQENQTF
jgi:K+-sensing histidine kinase KdpD